MIVFPNAKINLGLQILSKRSDGYHNIISCLYPIGWCDALEVLLSKTFSFHLTGNSLGDDPKNNTCVKAYELLKSKYDLPPIQIHLHKVIPSGAGLGGGSSDGAFMLKLVNELFNLKLDKDTLITYASQLGSDCAFFIQNQVIAVQGRGNEFDSVNVSLKGKYIVVVYPGIHSSTKEAYDGLDLQYLKKRRNIVEVIEEESFMDWKESVKNDFEKTIFLKYPFLEEIKNQLYELGAIYASMSGSGSSIYGIFDRKINLKNNFPKEYIIWKGVLN